MDIEINVGKEKEDMEDMAEKGENGDTVMGHLTPGEVVLPLPLVQKLAEPLKKAFEAAGMDMDQYTVGHEKNSINEESGCPEFAINPKNFSVAMLERMMASSPDLAVSIQEAVKSQELKDQEAAAKAEEDAARAELAKAEQDMAALQKQIQEETASGQAQIARTRQETEMTQRETGERRLARLRARVRSLSRPMLSKGVSL
jgi:hypothetical protein